MAIRFVLDEDSRGAMWAAVRSHNAKGIDPIDLVRVGDPPDLPLGTLDPELLLWAEREGRILVTGDKSTMPGHLAVHLALGHHSPGVFIVRDRVPVPQVVVYLSILAHASDPWEWADRWEFIP